MLIAFMFMVVMRAVWSLLIVFMCIVILRAVCAGDIDTTVNKLLMFDCSGAKVDVAVRRRVWSLLLV